MKYFAELGETVLRDWSRHNFDPHSLDAIAVDRLAAMRPCDHVGYEEVISAVVEGQDLPPQPNLSSAFGQPPVTTYWHPRFYIEVLFWTTGTTSIHQHGFSGAFALLHGRSVQSRFHFAPVDRVNEELILGDLSLRDVRILDRGDVEPIRSGPSLIHSVFHLDLPSVTVVLRTHADQDGRPQYSYQRPYLAIDSFYQDMHRIRRLQMIDLVRRLGSSDYVPSAIAAVRASDFGGVYRILLDTQKHFGEDSAPFQRLAAEAERVHGRRVLSLVASISEGARADILVSRREKISNPDHRFFLALLLNIPDKAELLRTIKERYRVDNPNVLVIQWAKELSGTDTVGVEFDELNTFLFERLLEGSDTEAAIEALAGRYSPQEVSGQREALIEHCAELQRSPVFRPLFGSTPPIALAQLLRLA